MTDHRPTPAPDGHLDDEATLDALDGALGPDGRAHLGACETCRAQVGAHAAVRDALAAPPPAVDPAVREAALAAALDAWAPATGAPNASTPAPAGRADELGSRRRQRRPLTTSGWLGAAAVVLLLVVALPLLALAGGGGDDADQSTASGGEAGAAADATEESATGLDAPSPAPVDVGDLGTIAPGEDLRPVVDRALGQADAEDEIATLDAPEASSGPADGAAPAEQVYGGPCVEEVREAMVDLGTLVLVGAATVSGEPARVLGFEAATSARPAVVVVVVDDAGCEIVTFQSHAQG